MSTTHQTTYHTTLTQFNFIMFIKKKNNKQLDKIVENGFQPIY